MTYLVVGLERKTLVPWNCNVRGGDPVSAGARRSIARPPTPSTSSSRP